MSPGYLFFRVRLVQKLHRLGESICLHTKRTSTLKGVGNLRARDNWAKHGRRNFGGGSRGGEKRHGDVKNSISWVRSQGK